MAAVIYLCHLRNALNNFYHLCFPFLCMHKQNIQQNRKVIRRHVSQIAFSTSGLLNGVPSHLVWVKILTGLVRPSLPPLGSLPWPSLLMMVLQPGLLALLWACQPQFCFKAFAVSVPCLECSFPRYPTILPFMKTLNEHHSLLTLIANLKCRKFQKGKKNKKKF